ncbi:MAG: ABC transporter ATP-binding protein [Anaerolineae bacterium]
MNTPLLVAEHLQMTFTEAEADFEALGEASFSVYPQEFVGIIGPSGCGKSTLLRILGGLLQPSSGRVIFDGAPLTSPQRQIGFVFQRPNLMPWRTALHNISLPLEMEGIPRHKAEEQARELLDLVGLPDFGKALPRELSGGMSQRVALARALVHNPDLLLLDEPFAALDALTREKMNWELIRLWQLRCNTVVMVTHNIQEAILLSDRVLAMSPRPGRIEREVVIDLPRPRSPEDQYTSRFIELVRILRETLR